jgi:3-keto-5-aminohexanoate cleavage enzyme
MSKKIILALAPTGGWGTGNNNPVSPEEISAQVISCAARGASLVHIHARDRNGQLTTDLTPFNQTVELIREQSDIILEASTGGLSTLSAADRVLPATSPEAEMGSLNIGSLNFGDQVYKNSLPDVRYWIDRMSTAGVKPSLEIFDTGHLETALALIDDGFVRPPCNFSFIFGVNWGMAYHRSLLDYLLLRLPAGSRWGAIFINSTDFKPHLEAASAGATFLRVGFEDSRRYGGHLAADNPELVQVLRSALEKHGYELRRPEEARAILLD